MKILFRDLNKDVCSALRQSFQNFAVHQMRTTFNEVMLNKT